MFSYPRDRRNPRSSLEAWIDRYQTEENEFICAPLRPPVKRSATSRECASKPVSPASLALSSTDAATQAMAEIGEGFRIPNVTPSACTLRLASTL